MNRYLGLVGLLCVGLVIIAQAGSLEPTGPPAPTMVTLQQIYDKLDECTGEGLCGIQKTGQTVSRAPGDDGEYQAGASVSPRFTDNVDGTVTDNLTGLTWLQNANCFGDAPWADALTNANTLADGFCGLTDGSVAGDWRLPNVRELSSLVDYGHQTPALPAGHPFSDTRHIYYSSTTPGIQAAGILLVVDIDVFGEVYWVAGNLAHYTWPVRGGL